MRLSASVCLLPNVCPNICSFFCNFFYSLVGFNFFFHSLKFTSILTSLFPNAFQTLLSLRYLFIWFGPMLVFFSLKCLCCGGDDKKYINCKFRVTSLLLSFRLARHSFTNAPESGKSVSYRQFNAFA